MRDHAGRKGVKGLSLVGHEKVPCGFGLRTGDRSNTADGAGNCGKPAPPSTDDWEGPGEVSYRLLFLFFFFRRTVVMIGMFYDWSD